MDQSIQFLHQALEDAKVGDRNRLHAFKRLSSFVSSGDEQTEDQDAARLNHGNP
jgi:hypothetical protein